MVDSRNKNMRIDHVRYAECNSKKFFDKYKIEIYNKYNIIIMHMNCSKLIFDSHDLLLKISLNFESDLSAGLSGPPGSN